MIKLRVCVFDEDCEEQPTDVIISVKDDADRHDITDRLRHALTHDPILKEWAKEQGFDYNGVHLPHDCLSYQVDTRENVIRFRDVGDVIGEPGNIACMFNLRLVE